MAGFERRCAPSHSARGWIDAAALEFKEALCLRTALRVSMCGIFLSQAQLAFCRRWNARNLDGMSIAGMEPRKNTSMWEDGDLMPTDLIALAALCAEDSANLDQLGELGE
jgi:hypothetical protein